LRWGGSVFSTESKRVRELLARADHARLKARASRDPESMLFWYTMAAQWLKRAETYDLPDWPDNVIEFIPKRPRRSHDVAQPGTGD